MEQCRREARKTTELLSEEVSKTGEVSWKRVLEVTDYDIGNNTIPRIRNTCM
jgi:hypothetical protein